MKKCFSLQINIIIHTSAFILSAPRATLDLTILRGAQETPTGTVSAKGQVVIPAEIRRGLGIVPGCQLDFVLDGNAVRAEVRRHVAPSKTEDGFGMLGCKQAGERRRSEFDVAQAMRKASDDRP